MQLIDRMATAFASLGPLGRLPAPGTWGSLAAVLVAPWVFSPAPPLVRFTILALVFLGGALACDMVERRLQRKDPGLCIIDEVLGQWITVAFLACPTPAQYIYAFALFRLFDMLKPPPVRASENWLPGGLGIMLDDALAGLYSALALGVLLWLGV